MKTLLVIATVLVVYLTSTTYGAAIRRPAAANAVGTSIYQNCSGNGAWLAVTGMSIPDCTAPPCVFKRGETATVKMEMTALKDINEDFLVMCGQVGPVCPTLKPSDGNICHLGAKCPIEKGTQFTITLAIPIQKEYPALTVKAYIYAEANEKDTDKSDNNNCEVLEIKLE